MLPAGLSPRIPALLSSEVEEEEITYEHFSNSGTLRAGTENIICLLAIGISAAAYDCLTLCHCCRGGALFRYCDYRRLSSDVTEPLLAAEQWKAAVDWDTQLPLARAKLDRLDQTLSMRRRVCCCAKAILSPLTFVPYASKNCFDCDDDSRGFMPVTTRTKIDFCCQAFEPCLNQTSTKRTRRNPEESDLRWGAEQFLFPPERQQMDLLEKRISRLEVLSETVWPFVKAMEYNRGIVDLLIDYATELTPERLTSRP